MLTEFEFINHIKNKYHLDQIGDDCAVLPKDERNDLVITADLVVEDIDFRLDWTTPEFLGHKALAVSLSDVAAMGARPVWAMLSIGIPENIWKTDFIDRFYAGWHKLGDKYGVELVGGDISRTPDKLVIDSIVGGEVAKGKAILRSTARVGDLVYVSGKLGGAAAGLYFLENGDKPGTQTQNEDPSRLQKQLQPQPQITLANTLCSLSIATSMIDLSDGISSDLHHLCAASGLGARIYQERIPVDETVMEYFDIDMASKMALGGGEDYELLFTVDPGRSAMLEGLGVTFIGEITATEGVIEIVRDGVAHPLPSTGFRHF